MCCKFRRLDDSRSYLMGVGDIDEKWTRVGIKIVEKTDKGHYKLLSPNRVHSRNDYFKSLSDTAGNE